MESKFKKIGVNKLKVDLNYQRVIRSKTAVKKIADNFDENLLNVIEVSAREDGYYIIDGQHRFEAAKLNGVKSMVCKVNENLSPEQEAEMFVKLNGVKKITTMNKLKARLYAGDSKIIQLDRVVKESGFTLAFDTSTGKRKISSVAPLEKTLDTFGEKGLKDLLYIVRESFDGTRKSLSIYALDGLYLFFKDHYEELDVEFLIKRLKESGIDQISSKARDFGRVHGCEVRHGMKMALVYYYNYMKKKRLSA